MIQRVRKRYRETVREEIQTDRETDRETERERERAHSAGVKDKEEDVKRQVELFLRYRPYDSGLAQPADRDPPPY